MTVDSGSENDGIDDRRENETEEDAKNRKRKERLEQNRISARESRKRKKSMIEELQRTVIALSRENKDLNERNDKLRRQLLDLGQKYPNVPALQAIVGQGAAQAPTQEQQAAAVAAAQVAVIAAPPTAAQSLQQQPGGTAPSISSGISVTSPSTTIPSIAAGASGLTSFNPMSWLGAAASIVPGAGSSSSAL